MLRPARLSKRSHFVTALLFALALLWPALVNGGAFLFNDTTAYVRGADAVVGYVTGTRNRWTPPAPAGATPLARAAITAAPTGAGAQPILAGRSVYYGLIPFLSQLVDGFWLAILLQSAIAAFAVAGTVRRFVPAPPTRSTLAYTVACLTILAALSPLPYYCGFMMPDLFTGLGILSFVTVALFWPLQDASSRRFWFALLCFSLLAHDSNLTIGVLGLIAVALIGLALHRRLPGALKPLGFAVLIAIVGQLAFLSGVRIATGTAPERPPFLAARLLAEGLGRPYLAERCRSHRLALCRHGQWLETTSSDGILWDTRTGWIAQPAAERRRLSAEQGGLLLGILRTQPVALIGRSVAAAVAQLRLDRLAEFNGDPSITGFLAHKLPPDQLAAMSRTAAWNGRMPTRLVEAGDTVLSILSFILIGAGLVGAAPGGRPGAPVRFAASLAAGLLLNAAVSAAVSGPHDRYTMRAAWLLPLAGMIVLAGRLPRARRVRTPGLGEEQEPAIAGS